MRAAAAMGVGSAFTADFQIFRQMEKAKYSVEVTSGYAEWWRYNIYLSVVEFNAAGEMVGYGNVVDHLYDIENGASDEPRQAPEGFSPTRRTTVLATAPCDHVAIYLYVIANTFPQSTLIRDSPPFTAELVVSRVSEGGSGASEEVFRRVYDINQWGGLTLAGLRVPTEPGAALGT